MNDTGVVMKRFAWTPLGILTLAVLVSPGRAQAPTTAQTSPYTRDAIQQTQFLPLHSRPRTILGNPCPCPTPQMLPGVTDPKVIDPKTTDPKSTDPKLPDPN